MDKNKIWGTTLSFLKANTTNLSYNTWIAPLYIHHIEEEAGIIYLAWPNQAKLINHINEHYLHQIENSLNSSLDKPFRVVIKQEKEYEASKIDLTKMKNPLNQVAVMGGFALGYHWTFLPAALLLFAVPYALTSYVSLGSLMLYGGTFLQMIIEGQMGVFKETSQAGLIEMYVIQGIMTFMAFYRHRANIERLLSGTERKTYIFKKNKEQLDL